MSDNQDNKEPPTDSQETFYEKSQNINDSQMLDESQDFALVIGDDSDESAKNQFQEEKNIGDTKNDNDPVKKNDIQTKLQSLDDDPPISDIVKETDDVSNEKDDKIELGEHIDSQKIKDDVDKSKSMDIQGSDEEDVVQGTPPEIQSPTRKLLSGVAAIKRKAESFDEPVAKIQKISSKSDVLDEKNVETSIGKGIKSNKLFAKNIAAEEKISQSEILCDATQSWDNKEESEISMFRKNIIIAETQDTEEFEPMVHFIGSPKHDDKDSITKSDESNEKSKVSLDKQDTEIVEKISSDTAQSEKEKKDEEKAGEKVLLETSDNLVKMVTHEKIDKEMTESSEADEPMDIAATNVTEIKITEEKKLTKEGDTNSCKVDKEYLNVPLPSSDSATDSNCESGSMNSNKSRKSIELVYDSKSASQERKKRIDLVEIDEESEKIILDSSNEDYHLRMSTDSLNSDPKNSTLYKSCMDSKSNSESSYKSTGWIEVHKHKDLIETSDSRIINGDEDIGTSGTTQTVSTESSSSIGDVLSEPIGATDSRHSANASETKDRFKDSSPKLNDTMGLINSISENEGDSPFVNENIQSKSQANDAVSSSRSADPKTTVIERQIRMYIKMKYLSHIDDATKEMITNEVTKVYCEPFIEPGSPKGNQDTSGCLADISGNGNRDTSPGSVTSNPQLYALPLSRLSIASTVSSSSSVSSAASFALKYSKSVHFSMPTGRAKHTKRPAIGAIMEEKLNVPETFDGASCTWENTHLISDAIIQKVNMVHNSPDIFNLENESSKREEQILSSTPEPPKDEDIPSQVVTPKSTKVKKPTKRIRTKSTETPKKNGMRNNKRVSPEVITTSQEDKPPVTKKKWENDDSVQLDIPTKQISNTSTPSRLRVKSESLRSLTPQNLPNDELVGKVVFAKWSDNNYYPGEVTEKTKNKFSVKFYDGKSKLLIEEFIIPMPDVLREGLSVYATTEEDDYGSVGIIMKSENVKNVTHYTIEMDNGKRIQVQTKDIFLKPDQAQILKEEMDIALKNIPKTPQHLSQVSLDNLVDGKRRSKRAATPTITTPKSRKGISPRASRITDSISPSGSGIPKVKGKKKALSTSESEAKTSESNVSTTEDVDGVQPELLTMPAMQVSKGPSTRVKGKGKSKQSYDDVELGPIPPPSSSIFKNMSFILTSTSSEISSRHHTDDSCSETGTENEEEWLKIPFSKDRVKKQLVNGGGTVYDSFKQIPPAEYKKTKLITNVPNLTAKSIQCLSVGITAYSHKWVIQCCKEVSTSDRSNTSKITGSV